MSILVETCPKCGAALQDIVLASYPPIPQKKCFCCGWSWTRKPEKIVYQPFCETLYEGVDDGYGLGTERD